MPLRRNNVSARQAAVMKGGRRYRERRKKSALFALWSARIKAQCANTESLQRIHERPAKAEIGLVAKILATWSARQDRFCGRGRKVKATLLIAVSRGQANQKGPNAGPRFCLHR